MRYPVIIFACLTAATAITTIIKSRKDENCFRVKGIYTSYTCNGALPFWNASAGIKSGEILQDSKVHSLTLRDCIFDTIPKGYFAAIDAYRALTSLTVACGDGHRLAFDPEAGFNGTWLPRFITLQLANHTSLSIPQSFFCHMPTLVYLSLRNNSLTSVAQLGIPAARAAPSAKPCAPTLTNLDLSYNRIHHLPTEAFACFPKLATIMLGYNGLLSIADEAFEGAFTTILLSGNQLSLGTVDGVGGSSSNTTTGWLRGFGARLTTLDLSDNPKLMAHAYGDHSPFHNMSNLEKLNLKNVSLETIHKDFFVGLERLTSLNLEENKLTFIEDGVWKPLGSLQGIGNHTLEDAQNYTRLPETLDILEAEYSRGPDNGFTAPILLKEYQRYQENLWTYKAGRGLLMLRLNDNWLKTMPSILPLNALRLLSLRNNNIRELGDDDLLEQHWLVYLDLSYNFLRTISDKPFRNLKRLIVLDLSANRLQSVANGTFWSLTRLRDVKLNYNKLQTISGLFNAESNSALQMLALVANELESISFQDIPQSVQTLILRGNRIHTLDVDDVFQPDKVTPQMMSIQHMDLTHNQVTSLRRNHFPLTLRTLFLAWNNISDEGIDNCVFCELVDLNFVTMHGNRLKTVGVAWFQKRRAQLKLQLGPRPPLYQITLGHNPFVCDCRMMAFRDIVQSKDPTFPTVRPPWGGLQCTRTYEQSQRHGSGQHNKTTVGIFNAIPPEDFLCALRTENQSSTCSFYHDATRSYFVADCSSANLTAFPALPSTVPRHFLAKLYMNGNQLDSLQCHNSASPFDGLVNLTQLFLNASRIRVLEGLCFSQLEQLRVLDLRGNQLDHLDADTFSGLNSLKILDLSSNQLSVVDEATFVPCAATLAQLYLDNNRLTEFPVWKLMTTKPNASQDTSSSGPTNENDPILERVTLSQNPWSCDCNYMQLYREFLQAHASRVPDIQSLTCQLNASDETGADDVLKPTTSVDDFSWPIQRVPILSYNASICFPSTIPLHLLLQSKYFVMAVTSLVLLVVATITSVLLYVYKKELQVLVYARYGIRIQLCHQEDVDEDVNKVFDAFVCFGEGDEEFVMRELVPRLEGTEQPFRLCLHNRHFLPGAFIKDNIEEAVKRSRRTIFILSDNFLRSDWCHYEFKTAHREMMRDHGNRVIVIVLGKLPATNDLNADMKRYLKTNTYLKWEDKLFWNKLYFAMPDRKPNGAALA